MESAAERLKASRVVFFDVEGTLFFLRRSIGDVYSEHCKAFGFDVSPHEIEASLPGVWALHQRRYLNEANDFTTSEVRERESWLLFAKLLLESVIHNLSLPDELVERIYNAFSKASTRTIAPGALELITALRESGRTVGLLSNNDQRLFDLLDDLKIRHLFDLVFPTSVLGYKKPSPHCFDEVIARTNVEKEFHLYIGDSVVNDYHGAENAGWKAILYSPLEDYRNGLVAVRSFEELRKVL